MANAGTSSSNIVSWKPSDMGWMLTWTRLSVRMMAVAMWGASPGITLEGSASCGRIVTRLRDAKMQRKLKQWPISLVSNPSLTRTLLGYYGCHRKKYQNLSRGVLIEKYHSHLCVNYKKLPPSSSKSCFGTTCLVRNKICHFPC